MNFESQFLRLDEPASVCSSGRPQPVKCVETRECVKRIEAGSMVMMLSWALSAVFLPLCADMLEFTAQHKNC